MTYNRILYNRGTVTYKDFDLSFLPNPASGDIRVKTDNDEIKQSVKTILLTNYGERKFREDVAGNLNSLLFELLDPITLIKLQRSIAYALNAYEPRITVTDIQIDTQNMNKNELGVTIYYVINNSQVQEKLQVFLHRTR
jgi:phage baseplate assembly protein W